MIWNTPPEIIQSRIQSLHDTDKLRFTNDFLHDRLVQADIAEPDEPIMFYEIPPSKHQFRTLVVSHVALDHEGVQIPDTPALFGVTARPATHEGRYMPNEVRSKQVHVFAAYSVFKNGIWRKNSWLNAERNGVTAMTEDYRLAYVEDRIAHLNGVIDEAIDYNGRGLSEFRKTSIIQQVGKGRQFLYDTAVHLRAAEAAAEEKQKRRRK